MPESLTFAKSFQVQRHTDSPALFLNISFLLSQKPALQQLLQLQSIFTFSTVTRRVGTITTAGIVDVFNEKVRERKARAGLFPSLFDLPPASTIIDATLAVRHSVLRSQYVRSAGLTMRLALTALALAAVSLVVLSLSAPIVFHGQIVTLQVSLISTQADPAPPPPSSSAAADNSSKYFCEHTLTHHHAQPPSSNRNS